MALDVILNSEYNQDKNEIITARVTLRLEVNFLERSILSLTMLLCHEFQDHIIHNFEYFYQRLIGAHTFFINQTTASSSLPPGLKLFFRSVLHFGYFHGSMLLLPCVYTILHQMLLCVIWYVKTLSC